ncbi:MAG TPA: YceI family protein [Phenylobacterium sp.]|nr:YceI family protein [Phenylobacterium sp.]
MNDIARTSSITPWRYAPMAILLHWLIAAAIVLQIALAGRMEGHTPQAFAVTQLHKSVGVTILLLSLVRLAWRLTHPPAPLPAAMPRWEKRLAEIVHVGFYGIMIAMPLTGWLMVSAGKTAIPTLLYGVVHWPDIPGLAGLAPAAKKTWADIGSNGHELIAKLIYVLLALHVAGALKHQLLSRDEPVLGRMAPGAVPGRRLEPRLFFIALAALAVVVFGKWIQPPLPGAAPLPPPPAAGEVAPESAPVAAPAGPATAAAWTVSSGSTLGFATAWSGSPIAGRFDKWHADILFGPEALDKSKVTVTVDLASVKSGDVQRDASLPSADWFDVANHPQAVFTATRFQKTGPDAYLARGTLDLRGVRKPQDLAFRLRITGDTAKVSGTATLDRLAFGVGRGKWAATDSLPAKLAIRVDLTARRIGAPPPPV